MGATQANDFPRQTGECGQAARDHPRPRTNPDGAERGPGMAFSPSTTQNQRDSCRSLTTLRLLGGGRDHISSIRDDVNDGS